MAGWVLLLSLRAYPQDPPAGEVTVLEEQVVTARRREEDLQKSGVSATVLGAADLAARGATDLSHVADFAPNTTIDFTCPISGSANASSIFIRGVGQTDFLLTTDPGVGVYVDDVYWARSLGGVVDLLDVERVEVLRGPQGTAFGRNTIGGAVVLTTRRPGDTLQVRTGVVGGSGHRLDERVTLDLPLVEKELLSAFTVMRKHRDGFGERVLDGRDQGDENALGARGKLLWLADPDLEVGLAFDVLRERERSPVTSLVADSPAAFDAGVASSTLSSLYTAVVAPAVDVPGFGTGVPYDRRFLSDNPYKTFATFPSDSDLEHWGASLTIDGSAGEVGVRSFSAFRHLSTAFSRDPDHSPLEIAHGSNDIEQSQFSQEVRVAGDAIDGRLSWLGGVYFFEESGTDEPDINIVPGLFDPLGLDIHITGFSQVENTSTSGFAEATYALLPWLSATAGVRYTHEVKRFKSDQVLARTRVFLIDPDWDRERFDDVSPRAILSAQWNEDVMTYASVSRGFKSGGFVARYATRRDAGAASFDPEEVTTGEVGVKSELFDRRLRLNAAGFLSDYSDIQVIVFRGIAPITENAARGKIVGGELELTVLPAEGWRLDAGLGFLDARYTSVEPGSAVRPGDRFVNSPEWSLNAGAEYGFPVAGGRLSFRADTLWRSKTANDAVNTPGLLQDDRGLLNARITFSLTEPALTFFLFGTNLTDERYIISGTADVPTFGIVEAIWGRPREFGIGAELTF